MKWKVKIILGEMEITEGLYCRMPLSVLHTIAAHSNIQGHMKTMLHYWLKFDTKASWENPDDALTSTGKKIYIYILLLTPKVGL